MLDQFLSNVRRRHFLNLALEYIVIATGVGAAGALLLLLLGTQIMDWYWPALLFAASLAAGLYRARKQQLSRYRVAQVADSRLGLDDRLSTVVWFREHGGESPDAIDTVEHQVMERLHPEDASRAMPVRTPRHAYVCAGLLLAAGGLLGLRYGMLRTMDLSAPIASIDLGIFQPEVKVQAATKKSAIQERYEQQLQELGLNVPDMQGGDDLALQPIEGEVPASGEQGTQAPDPNGKKSAQTGSEQGEEGEGGEQSKGETAENADAQAGQESQQGQQGQQGKQQQQAPQNAKNGQQGSQNSLMNKMRDALANMLNKMKSQPQGSDQQTASNQQSQQQQSGPRKQGQNQQGIQSKSKSQGEGSQSQEQNGDQESGEKMASDKSKAGDNNSDKPGSENSKSGMGQSEGDKDIRAAEQLAAMGKISEIFGRRAQQLTGEITVEVASGKQQLKTAWSERKSLHSDTGAEVNRDEIPLAYQTYIQRYFEEVRKSAAKAPKSGS